MSYILDVKLLSGWSEVGDHEVNSICYILRKNTNDKKSPSDKMNVTKNTFFLSQTPTLINFLLFICNSSMSWSKRFVFSLKVCVRFSIFDSILFLLRFIFTLREHQKTVNLFFNWNLFHARLISHYKAWSYKKK